MKVNKFTSTYKLFEIASCCVPSESTGVWFTSCHRNMIQNPNIAPAVQTKKKPQNQQLVSH